jgi:hypothetical protein
MLLAPLATARMAPQSKPALAADIERLVDQLVGNDEHPEAAERVREIFRDQGAPTIDMVGAASSEDFIVLVCHDQPIVFMEQVLGAIDRGPPRSLPPNAAVFLRARVRQKRIESAIPSAVAQPQLRDRIARLIADDQGVRTQHADDPARWSDVDKRTGVEVRAIVAEHGVPTPWMVGTKAVRDFVVLVQHQPPDLMRHVLPKLEANVHDGNADPADFAMMFDRMQMYDGKPQHYGSNFECAPDKRLVPTPIEQPGTLDERRAAIGLMPMRLYTRLLLAMYPKDFCAKALAGSPPK